MSIVDPVAVARKRLENNGRNPANNNAGIRVGSDLHLCEMLVAEVERLRGKLNFLIEEIIDREGREGMTDYDFAEQVIALAQSTRDAVMDDKREGK